MEVLSRLGARSMVSLWCMIITGSASSKHANGGSCSLGLAHIASTTGSDCWRDPYRRKFVVAASEDARRVKKRRWYQPQS